MTIEAHLAELERRHQALDDEIAEAIAHNSTGDLEIAELKRQKLQLKDEIERGAANCFDALHAGVGPLLLGRGYDSDDRFSSH